MFYKQVFTRPVFGPDETWRCSFRQSQALANGNWGDPVSEHSCCRSISA